MRSFNEHKSLHERAKAVYISLCSECDISNNVEHKLSLCLDLRRVIKIFADYILKVVSTAFRMLLQTDARFD